MNAQQLQDHPLVSICRKMFTKHVAQAHGSQVHLHEARGVCTYKRSCTRQLRPVLTRILQEAARPAKLSMFLDAKRMIRV
jgi:hypothetical protein